jgi:hypothetical protein
MLVGGFTRIDTRYGVEAEPLVIDVMNGRALRNDIVIHFAIPPARGGDSVHQHCSLVLPFGSPEAIQDWCERYGVAARRQRQASKRSKSGLPACAARARSAAEVPLCTPRRGSSRPGANGISGPATTTITTNQPITSISLLELYSFRFYSFRLTLGSVLLGQCSNAAKIFCRGRDASVALGGDPRRTAGRFPDRNISVQKVEPPNARLPKVGGRKPSRANCESKRGRRDRAVCGRTWICGSPCNSADSFPTEPQLLCQMHTRDH